MENNRLWIYRPGEPVKGKHYVLYWMQQAQRTHLNLALDWAIQTANSCNLPLLVAFALKTNYPGANARHYQFMLEGLQDVEQDLQKRHIGFIIKEGDPEHVIPALAKNAAIVVGDIGYLRIQRCWRKQIAERIDCPFSAIETDVAVPIRLVSNKEEYAARTIRPKIHRIWKPFLNEPYTMPPPVTRHWHESTQSDINPTDDVFKLKIDTSVACVKHIKGGQQAAKKQLEAFIRNGLPFYHTERNDPANNLCSNMSPYLHFGQICSLDITRKVLDAETSTDAKDSYLEELIVRRELSMNFIYFNTGYDKYDSALPEWAKKTLHKHVKDKRPAQYTRAELEAGETRDPYWNAAQQEMVHLGKMHNYMRMYWGKKVIEWSKSPEEAFELLTEMNDRYELDGRDANGYTGIAWCFGKHDRPWTERDIFGTVRYMAASGLERKFKIKKYVERVNEAI